MADPVDYKSTLNLPQTAFPMKANLAQLEPRMLARWESQGTYRKLMELNATKPRFVLHDGPPYANGHIHLGHFLNKILKDVVAKYQNMSGRWCDFIPGWDCHGLPIELNVLKDLGSRKRELDQLGIRGACRAYAQKFLEIQREEFKRLGVLARWDQPYSTMSFDYEAQTVRELAKLAAKGNLYRGKKPVHWCMTDQTALAEAEVEYEDHTSPSIYVAFPAIRDLGHLAGALQGRKVELLIWTTTPWTLPANLAIAVHPDFAYLAYELNGRVLLVARDRLIPVLAEIAPDELATQEVKLPGGPTAARFSAAALRDPTRILAYLDGKALEGLTYRHVLFDRESPVLLAAHVTLEQGSGLVHTAPGHGHDDYLLGMRHGLAVLTPVDAAGRFTEEAGEWKGLKVFEANPLIIQRLVERGALLSDPKAQLKHSYPHCWRCKNPVIFRATDQWFIGMDDTGLRKACLAEIDRIQWIPAWGRDRIHGMIESRPDWCISRQRTWGVPIAVVYCEACGEPLVDPALMERAAARMDTEGADAWYARPASDFTAPGQRCAKCQGTGFRKESDILDVWFDSGTSYAAVAERRPSLGIPADLYLEGSDQHRGWFHSTLMCGVGTRGRSPYQACLTHGFVVDGHGRKLSKSLGNYIAPEKVLATHGAEILRLWVAAEDYRDDIRVSDEILKGLAEAYRKIRNTLRYALSALYDFDPARDAVPEAQMLPLDRWALSRLREVTGRVLKAYAGFEFHLAYHAVLDFCSEALSATYFDINKDRLYTSRATSPARRSAQTAIHRIAVDLLRLLAPILSFTADEAWGFLPGARAESVFLAGLPEAAPPDRALEEELGRLFQVRGEALKALEGARQSKLIGSSLEARVILRAPAGQFAFLEPHRLELPTLLIVSEVELQPGSAASLEIQVERARGEKCPRCWTYNEGVPAGQLCGRCKEALS